MITQFELKDNRTVHIKRLGIEDYEENNNYEYVHNWLNQVSEFLALDFEQSDLEQDKHFFYESLSDQNANFTIGAIFNGKIIASSSLMINYKNKKMKHIGQWGIAVHPDFQNKGLGTEMLRIIEQIAIEKGLKKLEAEFFDGNVKAERLYVQKLNYEIEGRRRCKAILKNRKIVDSILIGKIINQSIKHL